MNPEGRRPSRRAMSPSGWGATFAALALASCTVGPRYARPSLDVPPRYRDAEATAQAASFADLAWWEVFRDPALVALVRDALASSQDLAAALARVRQARALVGVARGERFPQVDLDGLVSRDRESQTLLQGGSEVSSDFRAAVGATWEIDLWGRVRRGEEAAVADYLASEDGRRAVVVALVGDVAEGYFDLLELDLELAVSKDAAAERAKTVELFESRLRAGTASELEQTQARADLAVARAAIPAVERRIGQQENLLAVLVGRLPGPVARGAALGAHSLAPALPAGLPSSLLERRPDVRAAEARVRAANARVGVATASMLPRVDLLAFLGLASAQASDFFDARSKIGSIGASLTAPIFHGGALSAERCRAISAWEEAVAGYRLAVQDSFRDVADELLAIRTTRELRAQLEDAVAALTRSVELASSRYQSGLAAYFEVLDAQRRLFPARIELARAIRDEHTAVIRLYRALGGGWRGCPAPAAPPVR